MVRRGWLLVAMLACSPSGSNGDGGTTDGGDGTVEQLCVDTINSYRASLNLPPYKRWVAAENCADGQAQSDSASGVAHGAFQKCTENAQNECPGWTGPPEQMIPQCLAMMWG